MDSSTVFTKTAKGITQVNQRSASLSKDLMKVLRFIDGKSSFAQILEKAEIDKAVLEKALNTLTKDGYARVFQVRKEEADLFGEDDFDFTAPGKMSATQRVVPGAANDITELVRQQEKVDADRRARSQAHDAARARAKAETEVRAKLEADARAKAQAEKEAMEQARRAKEAAERARVELEAKLREEEARRKALAEQHARLTTEQKAKQEAEAQRLAQLRAKAEKEAQALAEARARAEAEAQALARARVEAEEAAQRQAKEATSAEQQLKVRLKEEIEGRIRGEMEALLRNELEEKTRNEMRAQILAEARLAAKAELEERLDEERETLARAELEARTKAEAEARARADEEARRRKEAEARAAAETQARIRAEEEAQRLRQSEQKAREEADALGREQQETARRLEAERREKNLTAQRLEAERLAKYEAEARARIEAEQRERRERELQASLATIAEDTRVKVQAELEADLGKRAEIEGKAQAKAYMEAKARAEVEEEESLRAEQERKARAIAEVLRTKVEPDEAAPQTPVRRRRRRRGSLWKGALAGLVVLAILGLIALHIVPMHGVAVKVERAMSAWLHDDVSIGELTVRLVPTPHLSVADVTVGRMLDAKAATGRIDVDLASLISDHVVIHSLELDNVEISSDAVHRIPLWGRIDGKAQAGPITTVRLQGVRIAVKPAVDPFNATLAFAPGGALQEAKLASTTGMWNLQVKPAANGLDFNFSARNWSPPLAVSLPNLDVSAHGSYADGAIVIPEFEMNGLEGKLTGSARVAWPAAFKLDSTFGISHLDAAQLVRAFTPDIAITGRLDGDFTLASESPTFDGLLNAPRVQGKFKIADGSISNVDLVAVMQSDAAGQRAGVTKFAELTGDYGVNDRHTSFRQVNLQGGVLRGNGNVEIAPNSALSGRLALEIRSRVAQERGAFAVSGSVSRPLIHRGG